MNFSISNDLRPSSCLHTRNPHFGCNRMILNYSIQNSSKTHNKFGLSNILPFPKINAQNLGSIQVIGAFYTSSYLSLYNEAANHLLHVPFKGCVKLMDKKTACVFYQRLNLFPHNPVYLLPNSPQYHSFLKPFVYLKVI